MDSDGDLYTAEERGLRSKEHGNLLLTWSIALLSTVNKMLWKKNTCILDSDGNKITN